MTDDLVARLKAVKLGSTHTDMVDLAREAATRIELCMKYAEEMRQDVLARDAQLREVGSGKDQFKFLLEYALKMMEPVPELNEACATIKRHMEGHIDG